MLHKVIEIIYHYNFASVGDFFDPQKSVAGNHCPLDTMHLSPLDQNMTQLTKKVPLQPTQITVISPSHTQLEYM